MLTNPLTFGPWLWLAFMAGNWALGTPMETAALSDIDWSKGVQEVGGPVLLGLGIFGLGGAVLSYLTVKLTWRLRVAIRRQRSKARSLSGS